jgi:hypothetical protein
MRIRFRALLLAVFLLGSVEWAQAGLITNGGFEQGLTGWFNVNAQVVAGPVHTGNYAVGLSVSTTGSFLGITYDTNPLSAIISQKLAGFGSSSKALQADLWYNVDAIKGLGDKLYIGYLASTSSLMSPTFIYGATLLASADTNGWREYISPVVDLSGYSKVWFGLFYADGVLGNLCSISSAFVDDVNVYAVPEPASLLMLGFTLLVIAYARKLFIS